MCYFFLGGIGYVLFFFVWDSIVINNLILDNIKLLVNICSLRSLWFLRIVRRYYIVELYIIVFVLNYLINVYGW